MILNTGQTRNDDNKSGLTPTGVTRCLFSFRAQIVAESFITFILNGSANKLGAVVERL
jgi:hypothetical protein